MSGDRPGGLDLSLVVPVLNEEAAIPAFLDRAMPVLDGLGVAFEILFVDDGSTDGTAALLRDRHRADGRIRLVGLSRNFGKEAALTAGLDHAVGAAIVPIDVDLQDPPDMVGDMLAAWQQGADVVYATRRSRTGAGPVKTWAARAFYRLYNWVSDEVAIPPDTGDFRLMDRKVVDVIRAMPERNRFMKGLFAWPGFRQRQVFYDRPGRSQGTSKWPLRKLLRLAVDGLVSFSDFPLKLATYLGLAVAVLAILYAGFLVVRTLFYGIDVPGYASVMVVILFLGAVQLLTLGVIGEYLSRIYRETKRRPLYVVRDRLGVDPPIPRPSDGPG